MLPCQVELLFKLSFCFVCVGVDPQIVGEIHCVLSMRLFFSQFRFTILRLDLNAAILYGASHEEQITKKE